MITLSIILVFSLGINVFFVIYLRWLLKKFAFLSENIGDMITTMTSFSKHLESIHELETYYGDATLNNLIQHSKQVVGDIEIYKEIYTLFNEENDMELERLFEREGLYAKEKNKTEGEE
tara:strand:+ start:436 stop:792 length:357 start_codon:yes stop_codon:yes gene_type:complete